MGTWNDLVPSTSDYLKKEDVGEKGYDLTIDRFTRETVGTGKDAEELAVMYFRGAKKGMILKKTNADMLAHIFGTDDPDDVIGKTINVYDDPSVVFGGKRVGGLRIRAAMGGQRQTEPEPPPPPPPPSQEGFDDDIPF